MQRSNSVPSFHVKYLLGLAQCFGLLPINGVFHPDPKKLHFNWRSKKTIYSIFCGLLMLPVSLSAIYFLLTNHIRIRYICEELLTVILDKK